MKKAVIFRILFLIVLCSLTAIDEDYRKKLNGLYKNSVDLIYPERLYELISGEQTIVILDTREREEYEVSQIKGALFAGYKKFDPALLEDIPLSATIIVYCSVGYRSEKIGEKVLKMGYTVVYNLYGGIFEWINLSYPVYDSQGEITLEIHGFSKKWSRWLKRGRISY